MPVSPREAVRSALGLFAQEVQATAQHADRIHFHPEDQLKRSVPELIERVGASLGLRISTFSESPVDDVGRPDLAIAVDGLLVGYVELKAPGEGTTSRELQGRNRTQLKKFLTLPNLIYTDARDWTFYQAGKRLVSRDVRLGDIDAVGDAEITEADAGKLLELLREFLRWQPIVPTNARALAEQLAPLTRMLRLDVADAVRQQKPALSAIYEDWKRTLFPEATADQFADSYAQTMTYGLLLAKLSGATALDTRSAAKAIQHHSSLLARTLEILTQQGTREELGPGLDLLERTIEAVDPSAIRGKHDTDPWLYFYEDFLAVYDPKLRDERGVYYTPAQVVKAQVTLVDELLRTKLNRPLGFADQGVTVLDPATGTGTYLLGVLQQGVERAAKFYGPGAVGDIARQMARNLYGFELLVGPYAVAHLRLSQGIQEAGGREPGGGVHIYLTDTLESPNEIKSLPHSFYEAPLAEEHRRAREVKRETPILVCIGNPPYERDVTDQGETDQRTLGGWIRYGDPGKSEGTAPLEDFLRPARMAGAGGVLQPTYNLYVYFWRWALWKVFDTQRGPGIVSFITASSYLRGPGFVGMREEMRRTFDDLWILDLEGGSLGPRITENVFDIRIPVAIAVGVRYGDSTRGHLADVHYVRVTGTRADKFALLDSISSFADLDWQDGQRGWHKPFIPESEGDFFEWPIVAQIFPWNHVGANVHRRWPIGETRNLLDRRWDALLDSSDRATLLQETRDRRAAREYPDQLNGQGILKPLVQLTRTDARPPIVKYGFRSFDRQWVIRDSRVADFYRPPLWHSLSYMQIFLTIPMSLSPGLGPVVTVTADVPDQHHFRGSYGGRDVIPLYRDADATKPNITQGLLDLLKDVYEAVVTPGDLIGYVVGVLGHPGYTARFHEELEEPGPRVPLTKDAALFHRAVQLGQRVIAWQTYAERFPKTIGTSQGQVPPGRAQIKVGIPNDPEKYPVNLQHDVRYDEKAEELHVGEGVIAHVDPRLWAYEVSGLRVVRSWLGYRMRERSGRKSSPLDDIRPERWNWDMTKELLELLWVLEGVVALQPAQDALLDEIVAGDLFLADELPIPNDAERQAPRVERQPQMHLGEAFRL